MIIYTCPKCNKEFNNKSNFEYHISKKIKSCIPIKINNFENNIIKEELKFSCNLCNLSFSRKTSLNRHIRERCKNKKYNDELETLKHKYNLLKKENELLLAEIDELKNINL